MKVTNLPERLLNFVSRLTPLICVELLIKDPEKGTLLSWRDDPLFGQGWHIPGGIVRYGEKVKERLVEVAEAEIGTRDILVICREAMAEAIAEDRVVRGHFLSFLYLCCLPPNFTINNGSRTETTPGYLAWHKTCPDNLIKAQDVYRQLI